jgi:flagellar basal-body rod modification protein FlgD
MASTGSITAPTADATAAAAAMKKSTGLNKDDFLKLFVTQLKNQDPLNPQDSSAFVAQLAQLTQVEQAYNTNTNLQNLVTTVKGTSTLNASSLIGRAVIAEGNSVNFNGASAQLNYDLPTSSTATTVTIKDRSGSVVRTLTLGNNSSGRNTIAWDGKNSGGALVASGVYNFSVAGKSSDGSAIAGTTYTTGKVDGIAFSGSDPVIKIGTIEIPIASLTGIS